MPYSRLGVLCPERFTAGFSGRLDCGGLSESYCAGLLGEILRRASRPRAAWARGLTARTRGLARALAVGAGTVTVTVSAGPPRRARPGTRADTSLRFLARAWRSLPRSPRARRRGFQVSPTLRPGADEVHELEACCLACPGGLGPPGRLDWKNERARRDVRALSLSRS